MADHDVIPTTDSALVDVDNTAACSREEAEALVASAIRHANGLLDNLNEIWRRRAWEPLGFHSIGDLLKSPMISEKILNPTTGKPYSRAHLHRIAQAANLQSAVAYAAEIDPADLVVDERRLRELGAAGLRDVERDVVEEIDRRRTENAGDPDPSDRGEATTERKPLAREEVQDIMDRGVAGEDVSVGSETDSSDTEEEPLGADDEAAIDDAVARLTNSASSDSTTPEEMSGQAADDRSRAMSATDAFDAALREEDADDAAEGRGSRAPEPTVTMKDALAAARVYGDTNAAATRIEGLSEDLDRTLSTLEAAVSKGREVLSTVFSVGKAGHQLLEVEDKAQVLATSLSAEERENLAGRLDRASDLGPVVEAVNELCQQLVDRQDVAELADRLNLVQVHALEAGQITRVCTTLSSELRGSGTEDDLEDLLAELGV